MVLALAGLTPPARKVELPMTLQLFSAELHGPQIEAILHGLSLVRIMPAVPAATERERPMILDDQRTATSQVPDWRLIAPTPGVCTLEGRHVRFDDLQQFDRSLRLIRN